MSRSTKFGPLLTACVVLMLWSTACFADLKDGLAYFDRGDFKSALAMLEPLAEKGDVSAQYTLGIANYQGLGMSQDNTLAAKWFSLAAAQGLAPAQYCLGVMYSHGQGVHEDQATAIAWYKRAAAQGYPPAFHNLAIQYGQGRGVAQDMGIALAYFFVSADLGVSQDEATRDMLSLNLKPKQVADAHALAVSLKAAIRKSKLPPLPQLGDPAK